MLMSTVRNHLLLSLRVLFLDLPPPIYISVVVFNMVNIQKKESSRIVKEKTERKKKQEMKVSSLPYADQPVRERRIESL